MVNRLRMYGAASLMLAISLSQAPAQQSPNQHTPNQHTPKGNRCLPGAPATPDRAEPVFIENRGEWAERARFLLRSNGLDLWLTDHGIVYDIRRAGSGRPRSETSSDPAAAAGDRKPAMMPPVVRRTAVFMNFLGAGSDAVARGTERTTGCHNYFIGDDRSRWAANVPLYRGARIEKLYTGIDAVVYLDRGRPRYNLVVAPGADPSQIRIGFEGNDGLDVDPSGALVIGTGLGELQQQGLFAYQMRDGVRQRVRCAFRVATDGTVSFRLGSYDRGRPLVIDPVVIAWSTYLGGSTTGAGGGYAEDDGWGIAVDATGNAVVTGSTYAADFPTLKGEQPAFGGASDIFVTKLTGNGTRAWSTYIGGSSADAGLAVAVDKEGNAWVTGGTGSYDFPTLKAFQSTNAGGGGYGDGFVVKLTSDGALEYSSYLGGSGSGGDAGRGIAVDGNGDAYIAGETFSADFPVANAFQKSKGGGSSTADAFVVKLTQAGTLLWSTFLGGTRDDGAYAIAVDGDGNALVTGYVQSTDFPSLKAMQPANAGNQDAFVTKITSAGVLSWSTFLGGASGEESYGIAADGTGNAYIIGHTQSPDFPTLNPLQPASLSGQVFTAFVTKLTSDGALSYSTYLGGTRGSNGQGIAVDRSGGACVIGYTQSTDFPTLNPTQPVYAEASDAFITRLTPVGALWFSTYLGGSNGEFGHAITLDDRGNAFVTGGTISPDFPTVNPSQSAHAGDGDAFVTKFSFGSDPVSVRHEQWGLPLSNSPAPRLDRPAPQPAGDYLNVRFALPAVGRVTLEIYTAEGSLVSVAMAERLFTAGDHVAVLAIGGLRSGAYILRMKCGDRVHDERFIVVR